MLRAVWLVLLFMTIGASALPWECFPRKNPTPKALLEWAGHPDAAGCADALYRRAERRYEAADFEGSVRLARLALGCDPGHAPARALFTEVQFILGQGQATYSSAHH